MVEIYLQPKTKGTETRKGEHENRTAGRIKKRTLTKKLTRSVCPNTVPCIECHETLGAIVYAE